MGDGSSTLIVRRSLLLAALMFWQGGFTFYSAVVIHVGHQVLGSQMEQGLVTRSVTNYLNLSGLVTLVIWGWDLATTRDLSLRRVRLRWTLFGLLVLSLVLLAWLHPQVDALIDLDSARLLDRRAFRGLHNWYLHISTTQWVGSLLLTALTLLAWRAEDRETHMTVATQMEKDAGTTCKRE